ncbi:MAG TPA: ribosomal protein S18-alanine N-acetyltransferase [Candidatus Fournierella merdipullorum]|uniref:[Ribosomal protein bS18]-alanine N-acetyltransferase n=1 Tax=Candidatus Allofournierella merdipullorum TaxID=2838595 RepID=A0A9D2E2R8_9FIRM|nr:ribosomal protein S18-alanine N-acetyltransferase [Candidatus Fournierella merdipullorum]
MELSVRPMAAADTSRCAVIAAAAPEPWGEGQLLSELESPAARLFVAEGEGDVLGFAVFQLAAGEASLYALNVDPAARRKGVGAALLAGALAALKAEGADQCFLEVRAANAPALALYRRLGFASAGVRRGFYRDPPDDAVVMTLTL